MITLEVFTDYACPYCYISKHQIKHILAKKGIEEVEWKPRAYILDPYAEDSEEQTFLEFLSKSKTPAEMKETKKVFDDITKLAKEAGLDFDMENMKYYNTDAAHRLTFWAQDQGKNESLSEAIFNAAFCQGKHIGKHEVLLDLVKQVGLDPVEAKKVLDEDLYADRIVEDTDEAIERNIDLIPHYLLIDDLQISGVPPVDHLESVLDKVIAKSK